MNRTGSVPGTTLLSSGGRGGGTNDRYASLRLDGSLMVPGGDGHVSETDVETDAMLSSHIPSPTVAREVEAYSNSLYGDPDGSLDDPESKKGRRFDFNLYATKKSAAQGLLDLALLMANASQLKYILMTRGNHQFYAVMLSLILTSLILQISVGIALLVLARMKVSLDEDSSDTEAQSDRLKTKRADTLNNLIVGAIFILTVINIFISSFGLEQEITKDPTLLNAASISALLNEQRVTQAKPGD